MTDPLTHAKLGTSLVLMDVDVMRQSDLDRYMAAMRDLKQLGDSTPETHHKIVYAGLKSGVVREARAQGRAEPLTPKDVGDLAPKVVRWFALRINALYLQATTVPPE
jgi:hypothetical protein